MKTKRCVCGKVINEQLRSFATSAKPNMVLTALWPEWLVFMVADLKREYRQRKIIDEHEIPFSELGIY